LTSGRLLARNVVWNLLGTVAPLLVAVPAVPRLIHAMGTNRFGVLTLAWVVIGYFSLFDFGFGRALTKLVAERLGAGESGDIPRLFWTSLAMMLVFGCAGGAVMAALSPWMVHSVLRIPAAIQTETLRAFYLLAASLPVVITSTALRGFLEAYQRFGLSNAVRVPLGVFTFAGPFLVFPFSVNLPCVVGVFVAARVVACFVLWGLCAAVSPGLLKELSIRRDLASSLFHFGGWMTVTNIVSPLMVSVDRFLIGAVVSISAVAYYATPWEAVTKLLIIPSAIVGVLFPAFSTGFAQDKTRTKLLFVRGVKYTFLALFPFLLIVIVFAREGLTLWVGAEFAQHGTTVLQLLAIGVFFNGIAQVPFALAQGAGRPDLTGKLHLIELPAYAGALWLLVDSRGIEGAALAWTGRVAVDAMMLFGFAYRVLRTEPQKLRGFTVPLGAALVVLALGIIPMNLYFKISFTTLTLFLFGLIAWFAVLDPAERLYARARIRAY
jgi:O-antigen/teichoic acid export membrane protein